MRKSEWDFHIIPSFQLYIEPHSPFYHNSFFDDGVSGLFASFIWGRYTFTIGVYKKDVYPKSNRK